MPRAFDRGIPEVDKNPLISATAWGDPETIIGEAAANAAGQIQGFFFSLFQDCVEFLEGLKLLGDGDNPLVQLGTGLQALIDQLFGLISCNAGTGLTPQSILAELGGWITPLAERWTAFLADWLAINWLTPTSVHTAWMLVVDLVRDLWNIVITKIEDYFSITAFPDFLDAEIFKAAWQAFNTAWAAIDFTDLTALWDALRAVLKLARDLVHWAAGVFANITGIDLEALLDSLGVTALAAAFTAFGNTLAGINWANATAIFTAIGAFITLSQDIGNWFLALIDSWLNWDTGIVGAMFDSFSAFVAKMVEYFFGATGIAGWIKTLESLAGQAGATIVEAITAAYDELSQWFPWLINFIRRTLDAGEPTLADFTTAIQDLLANIPLVGNLLGLAGNDTFNGKPISTITDLVGWFQTKVLTVDSAIPATNLYGNIPKKLLGSIGIGNVDNTQPNQVDLNSFPDASVMQAGGRWSWDGGTSRTVGSGSAKVVCSSSSARMFSNKIPVTSGNLLSLSGWVKWSGLSNSTILSSPISIGVRTYNQGVVQQSFTEVAAVPTIGLAANSDFVEVKNLAAWIVPPNVNEVRMAIGVNQSATAGTVWFDDLSLRKTNNLAQNLVTDLPVAFNGVIDGLAGNPPGTTTATSASGGALFTAGTSTRGLAGTAITNAGLALTGASGAQATANTAASGASGANSRLNTLNGTLFGSTSSGPTILKDALPLLDLGAELTTAGSGAQLSRRSNTSYTLTAPRQIMPTGFFDTDERSSDDIQVGVSGGSLTGRLTIHPTQGFAGWYLVEIGYRLNPLFGGASWAFAPLLYKNGEAFRVGSDATAGSGPLLIQNTRFIQSSWICYLDPGDYVNAGADAIGWGPGLIASDANGNETYFGISLLNRSYD